MPSPKSLRSPVLLGLRYVCTQRGKDAGTKITIMHWVWFASNLCPYGELPYDPTPPVIPVLHGSSYHLLGLLRRKTAVLTSPFYTTSDSLFGLWYRPTWYTVQPNYSTLADTSGHARIACEA
ncbi:hypothetical protein D9619_013390 [Psilocybe cf. subviscida]|uniref:Uncharacterized protein n=1 Tax=Psilocybe cf. subviscida TaxID=2480587 RepID=A0A8H5BTG1_9AGAR|nr:hypothetical protein D9619_013390 [Psilocybe cf. subviscida]